MTPCHLPQWIACPVGALSLAKRIFLIVILPFYPTHPPLPCWILTELLCPRTTWVYPSLPLQILPPYTMGLPYNTLQHPLHILCLSLNAQHTHVHLVQSRPSPSYIHIPPTHNNNFYFLQWSPSSYFARQFWERSAAIVTMLRLVPFPKCAQAHLGMYSGMNHPSSQAGPVYVLLRTVCATLWLFLDWYLYSLPNMIEIKLSKWDAGI